MIKQLPWFPTVVQFPGKAQAFAEMYKKKKSSRKKYSFNHCLVLQQTIETGHRFFNLFNMPTVIIIRTRWHPNLWITAQHLMTL